VLLNIKEFMSKFKLKLIAPDGVKYEAEATAVILPTSDGEIEILPGHMPLVSLLAPGEMIIKNGSEEKSLVTEGGVAEITTDLVKILADTAEEVHNLNELKIAQAKKTAEERLANAKDFVEFTEAQALLEKQLAKIHFLNKRKRKHL